jgi:hypothetical protein
MQHHFDCQQRFLAANHDQERLPDCPTLAYPVDARRALFCKPHRHLRFKSKSVTRFLLPFFILIQQDIPIPGCNLTLATLGIKSAKNKRKSIGYYRLIFIGYTAKKCTYRKGAVSWRISN